MNDLVLYCKSFNRDIDRAKILLESVKVFNKDNIPFYISVPKEDVSLFINKLGTNGYTLITDEEVCGEKYVQDWKTQQIIKSSFWKLGLSFNNLMVDSDSFFIRDFYLKDFIIDQENHIPYTIIHEQKDLFDWTAKNTNVLGFDPQKSFAECRTPIMEIFGRSGVIYDGGPGPMIFNSKVWESLENEYLKPNGLIFKNLIETVASEFSWYLEWMLYKQSVGENIIPLWPRSPFFKFFHYKQQYEEYKKMGYTVEHWKKSYLGLVLQSSSGLPLNY